jgi:hypothetical protein
MVSEKLRQFATNNKLELKDVLERVTIQDGKIILRPLPETDLS